MIITPGANFNGLKIVALCGGGAYGEVWYCEDPTGRRIALKIVSKLRLGNSWQRELQGVKNYLRITANSPNLLRIFHVAEDEDCFCYTMEAADSISADSYVPDTLAQRLQHGALAPEQLYPVLRGIFDGIKIIHEAGFAHRDIKPDNILFVGGIPKLGDIGLVSSLSNSMSSLAGTLEFLPPEVRASDTSGSADRASRQRSDLYAFGKVVYCAATGLDVTCYPSVPTRADLSPALKFFIQLSFRLCAGRPGFRIDSIESLERDMDRIGRDLLHGGRPPLAWRACHKIELFLEWIRRHTLYLLPAVVLLAIFGATFSRISNWNRTASSSPPPPRQQPTASMGTVEYSVPSLGLKMQIPRHWQAMSEGYIRAQIDEMTKELNESEKSEEAKKLLRQSIAKAKTWKGMIRCDLYDVIEIGRADYPNRHVDTLWNMPEEQLKRELTSQLRASGDENAKIYGFERTTLAGRRCIVVDLTLDGHDRVKNYMLSDGDGFISIGLTGDAATFPRRDKEFDDVLKTLSFTRPEAATAPKKPVASPPVPRTKVADPVAPAPATRESAAGVASGKRHSEVTYETREFADPQKRFSLMIPQRWQPVPENVIKRRFSELERKASNGTISPVEQHGLTLLSIIGKTGGTVINCDPDHADFIDAVYIVPDSGVPLDFWRLSDGDIRKMLEQNGPPGSSVTSVIHTEIAGRDTLRMETYVSTTRIRQLTYIIFDGKGSSANFALGAQKRTFDSLRKQFESSLETLKFAK